MVYCIDENSDEPIMVINSHIGKDDEDGMGVNGADFQRELLYLDSLGKKRIQVWINSIGGMVMDGYNIASAILKTKTPVDTYNVGMAASIAGVIFMCGRNRIAMDYSILMMHSPNGGTNDEVLNVMQNSLATVLSAKCNLTTEEISSLMDAETFMDASQMLDKGFATEVETTDSKNKKRMQQATDKAFTVSQIANKLIVTKTKKRMLKVTNKLGLNDDANEESILTAIKEIENKSVADKEAMQKEIDDAENALKDLKEKYNAMEVENAAIKDEAEMNKCTNMVTEFAKVGRIKNEADTIAKWTNLAKADFEGTKELIEGLPLNAIANKIDDTIDTENATVKSPEDYMAMAVKDLRNKKNN